MFRYDPAAFGGLERAKFLAALSHEGVPCSAGYSAMNKSEYVSNLAKNHHFLKIYGEKRLQEWLERNRDCPQNDRLCREAVWFMQTMLLGTPDRHGPDRRRHPQNPKTRPGIGAGVTVATDQNPAGMIRAMHQAEAHSRTGVPSRHPA